MLIEDFNDELDTQLCPVCGDNDNEDVLLLCDGCDAPCHTYCVGLDSVPVGAWFCENCSAQRARNPNPNRPLSNQRSTHHRRNSRTRAQQRRSHIRNQANDSNWSRVWMSVFDRLNIDLDFPFEEEHIPAEYRPFQRRDIGHRGDFRAWERRYAVAQRQGGGSRFRETASTWLETQGAAPSILSARRPRVEIPTPEPESMDEVRAWNAFERARDAQDTPGPSRRKRKSPTASPAEPEPATEQRRLKRPRTRRPQDLMCQYGPEQNGESSRAGRPGGTVLNVPRHGIESVSSSNSTGPSFLQSLLKEVEDSSAPSPGNTVYRPSPFSTVTASSDHGSPGPSSPRPSSPALSPSPSNHSSPRALSATPPPLGNSRQALTPLTSKVEPVFHSLEYSPSRDSPATEEATSSARQDTHRGRHYHSSPKHTQSKSTEASPGRTRLSLEAKSDVQRMVAAALKPHYRQKAVTKDQYTDINRNVSRMLYEKVNDLDHLDDRERARWERVASDEVAKAVDALKTVEVTVVV